MMGNKSRGRTGQASGTGKRSMKGSTTDLDSRRSNRTSTGNTAKTSASADRSTRAILPDPSSDSEDIIAPEIVVWTEDMDVVSVDSSPEPESQSPPAPPPDDAVPEKAEAPTDSSMDETVIENSAPTPPSPPRDVSPPQPVPSPSPSPSPPPVLEQLPTLPEVEPPVIKAESSTASLSVISEHSDLPSSLTSLSSKATTPVDPDSSKELVVPPPPAASIIPIPNVTLAQSQPATKPRRKYNVRPKVSIPPDLPLAEYAMQCIAGAEASRLNPYALHPEEYQMLRDHISLAQVTTYLNIRNGILRLWVRNPQIVVTREEAVGCAKDSRWFDVAGVCFDWLVRRGYINFGCVEVRSSRKQPGKDSPTQAKRKTVVVIGAGMSGLGCARQLEGLFKQYSRKFREMGEEPPRVIVLEGRNRVGGRVYSRSFATRPKKINPDLDGKRCTAEMGGMIITGFDRGNPINILLRGQLGLPYHTLKPDTTLYDSNGKAVDVQRDTLVEHLFNDCLDRVSEFKFKQPTSKLIEGNRDLIDEGKDSSSEANRTIRQVEEAVALQPHAAPVSEQNMAPQVNLVPVSSDRATGKVHTEPGTPGALKAAHKVKMIGWTLKHGVSEDADLDIEPLTTEPTATLGSVTDKVIQQYRDLVDLTAQDFRLMNWHIANLEYSNATNYNQLSLQGWDIDAGNEWEGSHTMVIGGYQSLPKGLLQLPTPLDLRQKSPVKKITYSPAGTGAAKVECEDGYTVEADYVVNTIPLGVLKHGNVQFEPPLPSWKSDTIERLGFGVLNKVILVFKEPFWDQSRDIFGVLRHPLNRHTLDQKDYASQRGRFFQWFNISRTSGLPVLLALMAGDAGYDTEQTCNDDLVREATDILRSVYGPKVTNPVEAVVTRWASDKFARGSYSSAGPAMKIDDYDTMARPVGNLYFAGEHTCGTHPATVHGAYLSGLRAASEVLDSILGPIEIPTPLIIPKESMKRKASQTKDPLQDRLEQYEIELWDHIIAQIGLRPLMPTKPATNAYIFYSKNNYDTARKKLEAGRRPGKGKPSANEVRVMSAKMWRDTPEEEKKPYMEMAEEQKQIHANAMAKFKEAAEEWDRKATELKNKYEAEHPMPVEEESDRAKRKRSRVKVESYAEPDSDGVGEEDADGEMDVDEVMAS
ncbi:putative lysine-specific histone demethylase 1 [Podospora australis]|uniref:Lysine-specific histone demethylase 1 n=1 Tax=Podospora australis TaxID=1536484 RepID=A0AAN7AH41_9PEZI|nr:putative lysine-specific histone demethylase 1 [Podospora australis]